MPKSTAVIEERPTLSAIPQVTSYLVGHSQAQDSIGSSGDPEAEPGTCKLHSCR